MVDRMDLTRVATELYQELPANFTAARNERAKAIASNGDRPLADGVRRLPKTSAAVWVLNRLAIHDTHTGDEFRALGSDLRAAQQQADRRRLDQLVKQRKTLVAETMKLVREICGEVGVELSSTAKAEIEQSLQAALADEGGAAAVFSGRLVRPIQSDGLDPVDLAGAVVGTLPSPRAPRRGTARKLATHPKVAPKPDTALIARTQRAADKADGALEAQQRLRAALDKDRGQLEHDAELLEERFAALESRREELDRRSAALDLRTREAREVSREAHRAAGESKKPR